MQNELTAESAKGFTSLSADEARRLSMEAAAQAAEAEVLGAQDLEDHLSVITSEVVGRIDAEIKIATRKVRNLAWTTYIERISVSRRTPDEVAFIRELADGVVDRVVADFEERGFGVTVVTKETSDYREGIGALPEYYETQIRVSW